MILQEYVLFCHMLTSVACSHLASCPEECLA